jgi:hypothetical protein
MTEDKLDISKIDEKILSRGYKGLETAMSNIESLVNILDSVNVDAQDIKSEFKEIKDLKKSISERTLNFIKDNNTYKKHLKTWMYDKSGVANKSQFISFIESELNKSVREVKMQPAILRRQKEKNVVLAFYKKNIDNVMNIIDLINKLRNIEKKLQKYF